MIFYFFTAFFVYTFHSPIPRPVPCGAVVAEIWHGAMEPRPHRHPGSVSRQSEGPSEFLVSP